MTSGSGIMCCIPVLRCLTFYFLAGMWSRSRRLGLETVSRRTNVSSRSRLGQSAQRLGLVSVSGLCVSGLVSVSAQKVSGLVSGLGPFRLVETFRAHSAEKSFNFCSRGRKIAPTPMCLSNNLHILFIYSL